MCIDAYVYDKLACQYINASVHKAVGCERTAEKISCEATVDVIGTMTGIFEPEIASRIA